MKWVKLLARLIALKAKEINKLYEANKTKYNQNIVSNSKTNIVLPQVVTYNNNNTVQNLSQDIQSASSFLLQEGFNTQIKFIRDYVSDECFINSGKNNLDLSLIIKVVYLLERRMLLSI